MYDFGCKYTKNVQLTLPTHFELFPQNILHVTEFIQVFFVNL